MAYTAGIDWTWKVAAERGLASTSIFTSSTPVGVGDDLLQDRAQRLARPAPRGPQVDDDGGISGAIENVSLESGIGDINGGAHGRTSFQTEGRRACGRAPSAVGFWVMSDPRSDTSEGTDASREPAWLRPPGCAAEAR